MKKQLMIASVILMMAGLSFSCCRSTDKECATEETCCETVSADSLAMLWNNAWNTKNFEALKGMIADSAMVIDHDWYVKGKDSLLAKWISGSIGKISNLRTTPLSTNTCCCCVSMTGLYSLDYTSEKGSAPAKGNFTFLWTRQEDKTYKLELMHLTEFHEEKAGK